MLSLIFMASLVGLGFTASRPASPPDSLRLISPAGPSSLGTRYPPGYPRRAYDHRYRRMTVHCYTFSPDPDQDSREFDELFAKVIHEFSDPGRQDEPVWRTTQSEFGWGWDKPGDERGSAISINLPLAGDGPDTNLTHGEFAEALIALNQVRLAYPMLDVHSEVYRAGSTQEAALLWFQSYDD